MATMVTVAEMTVADMEAMDVGATKRVIIGNPHANNGYIMGHDGTNPVSTGTGFQSITALRNEAKELATDTSYVWTLTRSSSTAFGIKVNGYDPYGTSGSNATWSTQDMYYVVSNATTTALAYTSDMSSGYNTDDCIRFAISDDTSSYLNAGGGLSSLRYSTGLGEWSVWYVFEVTETDVVDVTSSATNGTIEPNGKSRISPGDSITFDMVPTSGARPVVTVDGTRVPVTRYTKRTVPGGGTILLHMDGNVTDDLGNVTPTVHGTSYSTSTTKFGTGSLYLDGSSYVEMPFAPSGDQFSISMWVYRTSTNTSGYYPTIFSTNAITSSGGIYVHTDNGAYGTYPIYRANASSSGYNNGTAGTEELTANEWHHIECDRDGDQNYFFVDGDLKATITQTDPIQVTSVYLGVLWGKSTNVARTYLTGYIDEVLLADECRHTESFVPPTEPYQPTTVTGYTYQLSNVTEAHDVHATFTDWWYRIGGTWRPVTSILARRDGTWRPVPRTYGKENGSWERT